MGEEVAAISAAGPLVKIALIYAQSFFYTEVDADEDKRMLSLFDKEALAMFQGGMFNAKKFRVINHSANTYSPFTHLSTLTIEHQSWNVKVHIVRDGVVIAAIFKFNSKKLLHDIKGINQLERATNKPVSESKTKLRRGL
jgi:hypothetical protein